MVCVRYRYDPLKQQYDKTAEIIIHVLYRIPKKDSSARRAMQLSLKQRIDKYET
ncbi:MAG: hypothetical protein PVG75_07850 [Thioalkalispiraceae bacterium]